MLQEVDQSIRNLLLSEMRGASDGLITDESQILIGTPSGQDGIPPKKPNIRLFLHDVHENLAVRDQSFEIRRSQNQLEVGKSRKPTRLNLSYLLTADASESATEHRLLGEALGVLMRNGFVPVKHLVGSLTQFGEEAITLSVAQRDQWAHLDAPKVWQATGLPLRPFIGIVASALFDPFETKTVKLVREALFALGQGTHPEGRDRQMDVKSVRVSAAGAVSNPHGDPLVDVKVTIEGRPESTLTDAQGVFLFRNLPAAPYTLSFRKRGYDDASAEVIAPPRGLANELQPVAVQMTPASPRNLVKAARTEFQVSAEPTELVGSLRYADGRPASFIPVRIGERTAVTDQEGVYHFTEVATPPKHVTAEVAGRGQIEVPLSSDGALAELPEKKPS